LSCIQIGIGLIMHLIA